MTILTDSFFLYLKSRRLLNAFDVSSQNHRSKRRKDHFDWNISIQNFFNVSNIFTRGGVFMIRTREKHGKLETALWKLLHDFDFPLIFIF